MKKLILLLAIASVFSCSKKKTEDPQPQVNTATPVVVQETKQTPYYKDFTQIGLPFKNSGSLNVTFIRHDDVHIPKADVYKWNCHCNGNKPDSVFEIRIWWVNCVPYSDYSSLYFKEDVQTAHPNDPCSYYWFAPNAKSNFWWSYSR
jgi:hypothetical protein